VESRVIAGELPAKHPAGVIGARHVIVPEEDDARLAVRDAIHLGGAAVFSGPSGTSKTYTAISVAEHLAIRPIYVEVERGARGKDLHILALEHARGEENVDARDPRRKLRRDLRHECRMRALWIWDEVHRSGRDGRDLIRYLVGQPGNRAAFLLVGEEVEAWIDVDPAFDSRIARWVPFREPTPEQMLAFARDFHPLYETASQALLEQVANWAGVHKRKWARVIESCLTITDGTADRLTRPLLTEALHNISR
jgi:hypothetical protein